LKINSLLAGTLAFVLIAGFASPAFAEDNGRVHIEDSNVVTTTALSTLTDANPEDIVYENSDPSPGADGFLVHTFSVANDFVLENQADITDVHFILLEFADIDFDGEIQYDIFGDLGGNNGPDVTDILGSGSATELETEFLGTGNLVDRIAVWFDLEEAVPLDAGVRYWLHLHAGTGFTEPAIYALEDSVDTVGECTRSYQGGILNNPIVNCSFDSWFQITAKAQVVGGELLPIDSTALILAGLQTSAIWMLPVLAGVAGSAFGVLYIKSRRN